MSKKSLRSMPLVRGATVVPFLDWADANDLDPAPFLKAAALDWLPAPAHLQPVPLVSVVQLYCLLSRRFGPAIIPRIVGPGIMEQLAFLGRVLLGARSPRESLTRVVKIMSFHCTHELFGIEVDGEMLHVHDAMALPLDREQVHIEQLYVASVVYQLMRLVGAGDAPFAEVAICPHPTSGLDDLPDWMRGVAVPARSAALRLTIPLALADRELAGPEHPGSGVLDGLQPLRGDGTLTHSLLQVLPAMLAVRQPTLSEIAASSCMSTRSFQRRLAAEGVSFSDLSHQARRERTLAQISRPEGPLNGIATAAGYAQASSLTRAVRRWTGETPSALRAARARIAE